MLVRRSVAVVAALVLSAVLLAGCGDEEDPEPTFEPTPSGTVSESPSPSASTTAARETPEEFIRHWQDVANEMQVTGDTREFRELSGKCAPCRDFAHSVEEIYSKGGSVVTKGVEIISLEAQPTVRGIHVLDAVSHTHPARIRRDSSSAVETIEGGPIIYRYRLRKSDGGWSLIEYTQLAR